MASFRSEFPTKPTTHLTTHRGVDEKKSGIKENSREAFGFAFSHGANAVETDVRMTEDGGFVLSHGFDSHYKTFEEWRLDHPNNPSMDEFLIWMKNIKDKGELNFKPYVYFDIKDPSGKDTTNPGEYNSKQKYIDTDMLRMVSMIESLDLLDNVIIMSSHEEILRKLYCAMLAKGLKPGDVESCYLCFEAAITKPESIIEKTLAIGVTIPDPDNVSASLTYEPDMILTAFSPVVRFTDKIRKFFGQPEVLDTLYQHGYLIITDRFDSSEYESDTDEMWIGLQKEGYDLYGVMASTPAHFEKVFSHNFGHAVDAKLNYLWPSRDIWVKPEISTDIKESYQKYWNRFKKYSRETINNSDTIVYKVGK